MADDKILSIASMAIQVAYLGAVSNVLAQMISVWRSGKEDYSIDWIPVIQFMLYLFLSTPHNYLWQEFLENTFPAHPPSPSDPPLPPTPNPAPKPGSIEEKQLEVDREEAVQKRPLSVVNTIIKLVLDQTLAASFNTLLFSIYIHSLRLASPNAPKESNPLEALMYWTTPGSVDFSNVSLPNVWAIAQNEFWPMMKAGWTFWPAVSAINFGFVKSIETRGLVGSVAGVFWGIYLSLASGA